MESDIEQRLRGWCPHADECPRVLIDEAADEIERLRAELAAMKEQRDEARRGLCFEKSNRPEWYAAECGWDCFKEGGGE